ASGNGSVSSSGLWWGDGGDGPSNNDRVQDPPPASPPPARLFPVRPPPGASRVAERPRAKPDACAGFARPPSPKSTSSTRAPGFCWLTPPGWRREVLPHRHAAGPALLPSAPRDPIL